MEEATRLSNQAVTEMKTEYEAKLQKQTEAFQNQLASEANRMEDAHNALQDTRGTLKGLEAQFTSSKEEVAALKEVEGTGVTPRRADRSRPSLETLTLEEAVNDGGFGDTGTDWAGGDIAGLCNAGVCFALNQSGSRSRRST